MGKGVHKLSFTKKRTTSTLFQHQLDSGDKIDFDIDLKTIIHKKTVKKNIIMTSRNNYLHNSKKEESLNSH